MHVYILSPFISNKKLSVSRESDFFSFSDLSVTSPYFQRHYQRSGDVSPRAGMECPWRVVVLIFYIAINDTLKLLLLSSYYYICNSNRCQVLFLRKFTPGEWIAVLYASSSKESENALTGCKSAFPPFEYGPFNTQSSDRTICGKYARSSFCRSNF